MTLEKNTFDHISRIQDADSAGEILSILKSYLSGFGFENFVISHLPPPGSEEKPFILLSGLDDDWTQRYAQFN